MTSLHHLALFHAVASTGSVTAGAKQLQISQPAVSKQIKQLESALRVTLFTRTSIGIRLTPEGEVVAQHAAQMVLLADDLPRAVTDLSSLQTGSLRVGCTYTVGTYLLPEVLVRFRRKYPGIQLRFRLMPQSDLLAAVAAGDLDFAVTDQPTTAAFTAAITQEDIPRQSWLPIMAATHPLAPARRLTLTQFLAQPVFLPEPPDSVPAFRGRGMRSVTTLPTVEAIKSAVAARLGVALLPAYTVRNELGAKIFIAPKLKLPVPPLSLYQLRPAHRPTSKPTIAFAYLLKHAALGRLTAAPPIHAV